MNPFDKIEDPRRRLLIEALTTGFFAWGIPIGAHAQNVFGNRPAKLPPGQSIYRLTGTVTVNGAPATLETAIKVGDTVETGKDSEVCFVVGDQAMILRAETRCVIEGEKKQATSAVVSALRLATGKCLSVSRNAQMEVVTSTATIGIRGTGWYAESDPEKTYFCTCYGRTEVAANVDPKNKETITTQHHDRPVYILAKAQSGSAIRSAPFINHTDQELSLIETLVGRTPPFIFPKDDYKGPRRDY
jgi:hypothetical protein